MYVFMYVCMYSNNSLTVLYAGQLMWGGTRTLRNINSIYHLVLYVFSPRPSSQSLGSKGLSRGKQLKHEKHEDKNPHFLYTRLILDVMRLIVDPLSLTPPTVWPPAATQTRAATVSLTMQPKVFLMPDVLPAATLPICGLGDWLRIYWLAYLE